MTAGSWPQPPNPDPDTGRLGPADFEDEGIPAAADADADPDGQGLDGMMPPRDYPVAATDFGTTAAEERSGESLGARLRRELPEDQGVDEETPPPVGRLTAPDEGAHVDEDQDLTAQDVGTDLGGMTAEEAAMHTDQ